MACEDNLSLLGKALHLDLEFEELEKNVGNFRADILCRDKNSDRLVLIENQLELSDHNHLGQILTYAAGLNTSIMIWIAKKFTDEHRAVLDWLNSFSGLDGIHFFGVEIELWKIENSKPAPKFNIIAQPNNWKTEMARVAQPFVERRKMFRFSFANVPEGAILSFSKDPNKTCRVLKGDRYVEFEGRKCTLTGAASQILQSMGMEGNVAGPLYWIYEGESLDDRRRRFEADCLQSHE